MQASTCMQGRQEPQGARGNILAGPLWGTNFLFKMAHSGVAYFIFWSDVRRPHSPLQTSRGPGVTYLPL